MASNLFGRAMSAAGRIATRTAGRSTSTAASSPNVLNTVLRSLGPLGQLITRIVGGLSQELRRESEAEAARDVIRSLNRLGYDRNLRQAEEALRRTEVPVEAPPLPVAPPPRPPAPPTVAAGEDEQFDDIQLLGRDAFYHEQDIRDLVAREHLTPGSSNVYSFVFEREIANSGILYVTFKAWHPGQRGKSNSAGPTYAYYDVPLKVYRSFLARTAESAGGAVWDYLRRRGSTHDHQYPYRMVAGSTIPAGGVYVPRKATRAGFKNRAVNTVGTGRRAFVRSSLPEQNFLPNRARPNRAGPDRGAPDRGTA